MEREYAQKVQGSGETTASTVGKEPSKGLSSLPLDKGGSTIVRVSHRSTKADITSLLTAPKSEKSSNHKSTNGGQTTVVVQIPVQQQQQPAPQQTDMAPGMYDVELMQRINTDIIHMQSSLRTATAQNQQDQSALNELRERFETPRGGPRN